MSTKSESLTSSNVNITWIQQRRHSDLHPLCFHNILIIYSGKSFNLKGKKVSNGHKKPNQIRSSHWILPENQGQVPFKSIICLLCLFVACLKCQMTSKITESLLWFSNSLLSNVLLMPWSMEWGICWSVSIFSSHQCTCDNDVNILVNHKCLFLLR